MNLMKLAQLGGVEEARIPRDEKGPRLGQKAQQSDQRGLGFQTRKCPGSAGTDRSNGNGNAGLNCNYNAKDQGFKNSCL